MTDAKVNTVTGEIVEDTSIIPVLDQDTEIDVFAGISSLPVTREQSAILLADADPNELNILPTGEIYPPQVNVRLRLIKAFGPGAWALRPLGRAKITGTQIVQEWALYVNSRFIAYTIGGADYQATNSRLNWSDATESLKSNALVRCCKDLGMFHECWDGRWTSEWKKKYAVKVWVKNKDGNSKPQWRRLDADPFYGETGITDDSPNKDKYKRPAGQPQQGQQQKQTTQATQKPSANGSTPKQTEPVAPTPPTPAPVEKTAAEKRDDEIAAALGVTDELPIQKKSQPSDAKVEKPSEVPLSQALANAVGDATAEQVKKPLMDAIEKADSTVKMWINDQVKWLEKPADGHVDAKSAKWFTDTFVGEGKAFTHQYALFGKPNTNNIGHLGKHYNRRNFFNPKDVQDSMTFRDFSELVAYAWYEQGDKTHGRLTLPRYQEKVDEEKKKASKSKAEPTPEATEKHDIPALVAKADKLNVPLMAMAHKSFPEDTDFDALEDYSDAQREMFWNVLSLVEMGTVKADDLEGLANMIKMG